ncbi:MAG: hypothetical protein QM621_13340 [Aeromicrobium sp.]|uniref:hypothetical protein n=1 Tax=Aeromicrobium sp. TaxID=1871063 RepID=UPI0039E3CBC7
MATTTRDDDLLTDVFDDEGDRPRGCRWDESVCTSSPEYRVLAGHGDTFDDVLTFCPRHYALYLARLVEVHAPGCAGSLRDHIAEYGPISG